jgi:formylmethanofuran dehydrogenase subunit E
MKELIEKYPFLNYYYDNGKLVFEDEKRRIEDNYYTKFEGYGWDKLWKKYLKELFKIYDTLSEAKKKNFKIVFVDASKNYLEVETSNKEIDNILSDRIKKMSLWVCNKCGNLFKNEKGELTIYRSRRTNVAFCKDCALEESLGDIDSEFKVMTTDNIDPWLEELNE